MSQLHEWNEANVGPMPPSSRHSAFARVFRLARKELREILRDRRTIITLIAMPLLLYPLMSIVFKQLYLANRASTGPGPEYRVGALTNKEAQAFERRFDQGQRAWRRAHGKPTSEKGLTRDQTLPQIVWYMDELKVTEENRTEVLEKLLTMLREGKIDLVITIPNVPANEVFVPNGPAQDHNWRCQTYSVPAFAQSRAALADIEAMFAAANEQNLKQRLNLPLDSSFRKLSHVGMLLGQRDLLGCLVSIPPTLQTIPHVTLLSVEHKPIEMPGSGGISLAALVPLILILMTITGAVYPAIDLTAGERERGTLEILVAAPVSRFELLGAKYMSVVTVAILTALVNLVCMMATVSWSGLGTTLFREQEFSVPILLQILALLLLFAAFFSALLLCLTSFARSFKEAQAYLIPLMLGSLTPGVMAMLPGLELKGVLTVLPLVNIVLLARDLFERGVEPLVAATVVMTTLIYALAALALAARVFGAESVLYSEQSSWVDLVRRPDVPQPSASIPAALWSVALMVPAQFALHALMQRLASGSNPTIGILLGVMVNLLLFGCLPGLFLYLGRVDLHNGLRLGMPRPAALCAGLILGASLWPLELGMLQSLQTAEMRESLREISEAILQRMQEARASLGWGVLAAVIVPAILEEFFFRGLLFQALKDRTGTLATIGMSGLLFGISHVILGGELGLLRLVPSCILGVILSAVGWRAGSVWPCVILHVCHNTILLIVGIASPGSTEHIPWTWVAGGAGGALVGTILLSLGGRRDEAPRTG